MNEIAMLMFENGRFINLPNEVAEIYGGEFIVVVDGSSLRMYTLSVYEQLRHVIENVPSAKGGLQLRRTVFTNTLHFDSFNDFEEFLEERYANGKMLNINLLADKNCMIMQLTDEI